MSLANKNKCMRFYPEIWDFDMIVKACEKGKITEEEFKEITGEDFTGEPYVQSSAYDALVEQDAALEEAMCEFDTATDERLSAIEDALCEMDMA